MEDYYGWFLDVEHLSDSDRDAQWKEIRDSYLKAHPTCAACGATTKLQVHHIYPKSEGGDDDWNNLITLCMGGRYKGLVCHFVIGHRLDWHLHNPFVRSDAAQMLDRVTKCRDRKRY